MKPTYEELLAENLILRNALEFIAFTPWEGIKAYYCTKESAQDCIGDLSNRAKQALSQTQPNPLLDVVSAAKSLNASHEMFFGKGPLGLKETNLKEALDKYHTWLEGK